MRSAWGEGVGFSYHGANFRCFRGCTIGIRQQNLDTLAESIGLDRKF